MDDVAESVYTILISDINDALRRHEKLITFTVGDRAEQDYILSHDFYFKVYSNYTKEDPHFFVLRRNVEDVNRYPNLQPELKRKFVDKILQEIEGKI